MVPQTFLKIIRKHYPDVLSEEISSLEGNDHWVFVAKDKAFRFPKVPHEINPKRANFLKVFASSSPLILPLIEIYKDDETGINYEINNFIPGVSFYPTVAKTFKSEELIIIAQSLGEFLSAVHSFSIYEARKLKLDEVNPSDFWQYMEQNPSAFPEYKKVVYPHISKQEQEWIERLFSDYISLIKEKPFPVRVTHSDIWTYHIIVDPDKHILSGVIDFWGRIADPARDFKAFEYYGSEFVQGVYEHYTQSVDENFEKRRLFYTGHDEVFELKRQIKEGNEEKISKQKKSLSGYISAHPQT